MWTNEKLVHELRSLYDGKPWLGVTIEGSRKSISAEEAASHPIKNTNSIRTIVNHLIFWHRALAGRLSNPDKVFVAGEKDFSPIADFSEASWQKTRENLQVSLEEMAIAILNFDEKRWDQICPGKQTTFYENAMGIIEHDAYHLGQIVLLKKAF